MGTLTEGRTDEVGDSGTFLKILCISDKRKQNHHQLHLPNMRKPSGLLVTLTREGGKYGMKSLPEKCPVHPRNLIEVDLNLATY